MKKLLLISILGLNLSGLALANESAHMNGHMMSDSKMIKSNYMNDHMMKDNKMMKSHRKFFNYGLRDKPFQEGFL